MFCALSQQNQTALFKACLCEDVVSVRFLIENGADINLPGTTQAVDLTPDRVPQPEFAVYPVMTPLKIAHVLHLDRVVEVFRDLVWK